MVFNAPVLNNTTLIIDNLRFRNRYKVAARLLMLFLPNIDDTLNFIFILLLFFNNLVVNCWQQHLLLAFRLLVEVIFNLTEPLLSFDCAPKTV